MRRKIHSEQDLIEMLGRRVRIYWKDGGTAEGRLERSLLVNNRIALTVQSTTGGEGERSSTVDWHQVESIAVDI
ncbi:MAG: hypothetical protein JOZ24_04040 [Candidatus Eremiobacteraeota bacterium]|nr:hypothetical protein [Candidatus Eremiobacteraeota bacterium]